MPFKPGQSGNPAGRQKGAKDKRAPALREAIKEKCAEYFLNGAFEKDITELKPRERVRELRQLLDYVLPRLQRTESVLDVSKLSDEDIDKLLSRALEMPENGEY